MVFGQAFNGAGDTWTPTLVNLFCFWLWEIPLAYALAHFAGAGPRGVFLSITIRSEEHTSELQSPCNLVCRLLLEKKKKTKHNAALVGCGIRTGWPPERGSWAGRRCVFGWCSLRDQLECALHSLLTQRTSFYR